MTDVQTRESRRLAEALFAALSRSDRAAVDRLYADDFELWTAGSLPFSGRFTRAQAMQGMDAVLGLFPDGLAFTILAMTAEGERVAVEAESHGRHVSGRVYHNHYHFLVVVRDGKIVQLKEYMDTEHARAVLASG
ncbi:MAG: nuclear transport factor 2 family protein [Candidatus Binatia bacterium]